MAGGRLPAAVSGPGRQEAAVRDSSASDDPALHAAGSGASSAIACGGTRLLTLLILATACSSTVWWQVSWLPGQVLGEGPGWQPVAVASILAVVTALAGALRWLLLRRLPAFQPTGLFLAGALTIIASIVGAPFAARPAVASALTINLVLLVMLAFVAAESGISGWQLALALAAGMLIQEPLAIEQVARQTTAPAGLLLDWPGNWLPTERQASVLLEPDGSRWLRAYGPFIHPNILGGYLSFELPLLVGLVIMAGRGLTGAAHRASFGAAVGLVLGCLALSASRGAWLGTIAGLAVLGVGWWRDARRTAGDDGRTRWTALSPSITSFVLVTTAVTLATILVILRPPLLARFDPDANALEAQSVQERVFYDQLNLQLLATHPLFGVGIGNVEQAEVDVFHGAYAPSPAHNVPLLMAVELGPLGAAAWLLAAATILVQTWKRPGPWTVIFAAALAAFGVAGMFDHYSWSYPVAQTTAAILAGAWAAAWRLDQQFERNHPSSFL